MLMTNYYPQAGKQRGMSLVELMIGMLLGLILLGGVILVFTSSSEVNRNRMAMSAISDNARFTLEHMNRHLRMADPGSIEFDGDTLTALLTNGDRITYTLDAEDGVITFESGNGEEMLVDGINSWEPLFGVGDSGNNTLNYQASAATTDEIWSIRVNLTLEDPTNRGRPLEIANNTVGSTIALRNPLLLAIADRDPLPPPTNGGSEQPTDPGTPPSDDGNGDDSPLPPPEEGIDPETEQPIPDQPVACEADSVLVSVHHQNAVLTTKSLVPGSGSGDFISCDSGGKSRLCQGRVTAGQSFSMFLEFTGPGNQATRLTVDFKCVQ